MAEFNVRLRSRYDLEENWLASASPLLRGEIAFVVDSLDAPKEVKMKCGDGSTMFVDLPYLSSPPADLTNMVKEAVTAEFDERFKAGLILNCGGAETLLEEPEYLTEEAINNAVDEALDKILNTEY